MKKIILTLFAIIFTLQVNALTIEVNENTASIVPAMILECKDVAAAKIKSQAVSYGIEVDMSTMRVSGIDRDLLASFIWWDVDVIDYKDREDLKNNNNILRKLTQKPLGGNCF